MAEDDIEIFLCDNAAIQTLHTITIINFFNKKIHCKLLNNYMYRMFIAIGAKVFLNSIHLLYCILYFFVFLIQSDIIFSCTYTPILQGSHSYVGRSRGHGYPNRSQNAPLISVP